MAMIIAFAGACGSSKNSENTKDTVAMKIFPEPTDSTANGLHPYYPTEANILGQWYIPEPTDSVINDVDPYLEFLADKTVKTANSQDLKAVSWQLSGNTLVITHESGDPVEKGRMIHDTLVVEAVTDTSMHYYNLHEPNFIMHIKKRKS
jgi:hypothetical protein